MTQIPNSTSSSSNRLWAPSPQRVAQSNWGVFDALVQGQAKRSWNSPHALYEWSIAEPELFWKTFWNFSRLVHSSAYSTVLSDPDAMPGATWFSGAKLNFAENLLRFRDARLAIIFCAEGFYRREITYAELYAQVARLASLFKSWGVEKGDRVAALLPNMPESIVGMLAAASMGALWTSCSPDFGTPGVVDRFAQVSPKVFICADGYFFKGQPHETLSKARDVVSQIPSIEKVLVVPYVKNSSELGNTAPFFEFYRALDGLPDTSLDFAQLPFDHPLYIMYSSGTTGKPKCIVHRAGGVLIEHLKEHLLHVDLTREDRIFYQTTCGWMMWNWLASSLAVGATVVLFDGAPLHQDGRILLDLADREELTVFGTNAKYLAMIEKLGLRPKFSHQLGSLKTILSTGSPLAPESFDFVYRDIKEDVCLSSIAGGTDLLGCFALGCPALPVHRGELQIRSLGLKVEVFDAHGKALMQEKGELVCTAPFPSMPLGFWNDPDQSRYKRAYFSVFPNVWHHGDYVEITENKGLIFYGRSDAVLNPGGVRIGTAEIYNQVEKLSEILESIAIGQEWQGDVRVVLFVRLQDGLRLGADLEDKIRKHIRAHASPFHVPAKIIQVADLPRTRSGKLVELAVREVIHGRAVQNKEALANPEALDLFVNLKQLSE